ncbi:hypothetical protein OUZ56_018478 [Daphnia magna]|uniref:Spondin domain-containing protein n=1 Tax=Daphnia magna TaxID=35525 RepID=A0ABQ9Z8Y5_9CRUS|nr:hypothetical protein OUZ56_018478 [Daphnia magna]
MMNNQYWYNAFAVAFSLVCVIRSPTEARPENNSFMDMDEPSTKSCQPDRLTVYRVTLNTFWNHKNFPKHYPQWRPPAQWSKLVDKMLYHEPFNRNVHCEVPYHYNRFTINVREIWRLFSF